jgi:hypothetical protein
MYVLNRSFFRNLKVLSVKNPKASMPQLFSSISYPKEPFILSFIRFHCDYVTTSLANLTYYQLS